MKRFLLLWLVICLVVIFLPKILDRFTPKTIIKEIPIYRTKEVIKQVEVPIFKGEKIVEKEIIVYREQRQEIFEIKKIDEDNFIIQINDKYSDSIWEISIANPEKSKGILLHRKRTIPINSVSMSSVDWN